MNVADARRVFAEAECLADKTALLIAIAEAAHRITRDLGNTCPVVLCVMNGGVVFAGQLLPLLPFPLEFSYVHATRYGNATQGGELQWLAKPGLSLAGRHVLIIDDILDVGSTLEAITLLCREAGAASVCTAVLVEKIHDRKARPGLRPDYAAVTVPDRYVFGFGMDYKGYWRNAPGVFAVREVPRQSVTLACG
jgi:hypoxanthine phosphoribosyltransferase